MTPSHRLYARQSWGRAADAFETVAWRATSTARFDDRVANDPAVPEPTVVEILKSLPDWVTIVAGGAVAALMGAMLGGALHI